MQSSSMWGGRFSGKPSSVAEQISESISFDNRLYKVDIQASTEHARMLARQNIITQEDFDAIENGLKMVKKEIESGQMQFSPELEDIHMHIEKRLTEVIGDAGKRLHTGRSRNDQVATDTHLYVREAISAAEEKLLSLLRQILELAQSHKDDIWAGYTHLQIAQPVLLGHYLMSWFWAFYRDLELLRFARRESMRSPLGAAAMGGANYPIDRDYTKTRLGFEAIYENSMDAVANRDYQMSFHFFATRLFIHISRISEDFIFYSTAEAGYIRMSDAVTTGSSIMPQKKNPDIAELLRGKSARVIGNFLSLLVNLKGLPSTYNRDLQEDKVYLFDTVDQVAMGIDGLSEILRNIAFFPDKMIQSLEKGFAQATDIADYLVSAHGVAFREAHELSGRLVRYCEENAKTLGTLSDGEIAELWQGKFTLPREILDLRQSPGRRQGRGSTSPQSLGEQFALAISLIGIKEQKPSGARPVFRPSTL